MALSMGLRLPDVRVLTNKGRARVAADFAADVTSEVESGRYDERARLFGSKLLTYIAPELSAPDVLLNLATRFAATGFAAADLEATRGWQRPGLVDGNVRILFDWFISRELQNLL